jgi:hypothetical protein
MDLRIPSCAPIAAALLAAALPAQKLAEPFRLQAEGQPIAVDVGHAHPCLHDFDGDGVLDLLVGQFGEGMLRIYRNQGTNQKPEYEAHKWFEAGGEVAKVPAA